MSARALTGVRGTAEERLRANTVREGDCLLWRRRNKRPIYMRDDDGTRRPIQYVAYRLWVDSNAEPGVPVWRACGDRRCVEPTHLIRSATEPRDVSVRAKWQSGQRGLTKGEVLEARRRYDSHEGGFTAMACRLGLHVSTVIRAARRQAYSEIPEVNGTPREPREGVAILSPDQVRMARRLWDEGHGLATWRRLSRLWGVSKECVQSAACRISWLHLPEEDGSTPRRRYRR